MSKYLTDSRLITMTAIGGCLEFFDFTLFALFSTYISQTFFPFGTHITALINTFAIFAVGYFARPVGGLLISHFGDRIGRKKSLLVSIYMMALTTLGIALLPGYSTLGFLAPLLLILLRLLQGCALGGEMPGIITYLVEHFHQKEFVKAIAIVFGVITFGNMLASGLGFILSSAFSTLFMMQWGWRLPFLLGALLGFIGWLIRKHASETAIFIELENKNALQRIPFLPLLKYHWHLILIAAGTTAITSVTIFLFLYLPVFIHTILKQPIQEAYLFSTLSFTLFGGMTIVYGYFSKNDNLLQPIVIAIVMILLISLLAIFKNSHSARFFEYFCLFLACVAARVNTSYPSLIGQLFPASIRYSGVAMAYNIGIAFFGALTPFILLSLYKIFYTPLLPFFLVILASMITLLSCWYVSDYLRINRQFFPCINGVRPEALFPLKVLGFLFGYLKSMRYKIMQNLTIRKANIADMDHVVDLLTGYRSFYKCDTDQSSLSKFIEARVKNNESIIFLAFLQNEAIGIAQLYPTFTTLGLGKIWILNDLFVSSTQRGCGFGKALLDAVVEFAKEDGAKRVYLKTEHDNMPAKKLYEQYGFKPDLKFAHYILEI